MVRTHAHNLFCEIYGTKWDRAGFVHEDFLWLYWCIPTAQRPYIGSFVSFSQEIRDCLIMYSSLDTRIKDREFSEALATLDTLTSMSLEEQYTNGAPLGIRHINRVFNALEVPKETLQQTHFLLPKIFTFPQMYSRDNRISPILCTDLMDIIARRPSIALGSGQERLKIFTKQILSCLDKFLEALDDPAGTLSIDSVSQMSALCDSVRDYMMLPPRNSITDTEKTSQLQSQEGKDLILVVRRNGSSKRVAKDLKRCIESMLQGQRIIDLPSLVNVANEILDLLQTRPIEPSWPHVPYSQFIGVVSDSKEKSDSSVEIAEKELRVSLSGQGLEKLNSQQLHHLLVFLETNDQSDALGNLRLMTTKCYYKAQREETTRGAPH